MNADRGEVAVLEELVELRRSLDRLDEDADLRQTSREMIRQRKTLIVVSSPRRRRTWLNSSESSSSFNFLFFSFSSSWT